MNEFWKVLELEPTSDTTAIRHAYAQKTRNCHPEENPEGFLELRKAYQAAMDYAQQGRESGSVSSREQRDSGENPVQEKGTGDTGKFQQGKEPDEKAACFLMKKEKKRKRNTSNVKNEPEEMSLKSSRKNSLTGKLSISDWIENLLKKLFKLKRWFFRKEKLEESENPFCDGEAIQSFTDLYTGKQRNNSKLWMEYFTSAPFLDAGWDRDFTALLRGKVEEAEQDFPPGREFMMWLGIVYQFSVQEEIWDEGEPLQPGERKRRIVMRPEGYFEGMESIYSIAVKGPFPKRPGGDELAVSESFKDYRHLVRIALGGSWNEQALKEFKWIVGRYTQAYIKEHCDPKVSPDYQRHPAGLKVFIHFFQRNDLPQEIYRTVWQKLNLKDAVRGQAKIFYGSLRELVVERVPGIAETEQENFFQLNRQRAACFASIRKDPDQEEVELDSLFAQENVRVALHSGRFVEEQLLSGSDWLNRMTPKGVIQRLMEFYRKNRDIPGWNRVVERAEQELEDRDREKERKDAAEKAVPEELNLSLLLKMPKRIYLQFPTGPEQVYVQSKAGPERNYVESKADPEGDYVELKAGPERNCVESKAGPEQVYVQPKAGPEEDYVESKAKPEQFHAQFLSDFDLTRKQTLTSSEGGCESDGRFRVESEQKDWKGADRDKVWEKLREDENRQKGRLPAKAELDALFGRFAEGELTRLELEFDRTTLVLVRDKDRYACFCFETDYDTWYTMLSQPEVYRTVDSDEVEYLPFGMGRLADYNIHGNPHSILGNLNLVFMQIGRGRIQTRVGDCWLWSSSTDRQNGSFKKRMAMQKLAKIPESRAGGSVLSKFVFSQYPARMESVSLSGEKALAELKPGSYNLASAALAQFFQQKLAKLRLSWKFGGKDWRHLILLSREMGENTLPAQMPDACLQGRYAMAWLRDDREQASLYTLTDPGPLPGQAHVPDPVQRDLSRIRNCLDLILEDVANAELVTDRSGEFVLMDCTYSRVRELLVEDEFLK